MNRRVVWIVAAIVLAVAGGGAYLLATSDSQMLTNNTTNSTSNESDNSKEGDQQTAGDESTINGAYIDYSANAITEAEGTKLLFFHAPWCPQCRTLDTDIQSRGVPDGVTIIKVDYDSNQALRQKYGVTLQTTIVRVDDQGNLIGKFVAYDDPSLDAIKNQLL